MPRPPHPSRPSGPGGPSARSRMGDALWRNRSGRGRAGIVAVGVALVAVGAGGGGDGTTETAAIGASAPTVTAATGQEPEEATAATAAPTSTTTAAPSTTASTAGPPSTAAAVFTVTDVVDGDTVQLANGARVRLIGIDTPEQGECGYSEAASVLEGLVGGEPVRLVAGARDDVDAYGRLLRYLEVDGVDANLTMLNSGRARARYDSRDGYGRHDREDAYVAADDATPSANVCAAASTTAAPPPPPPPTVTAAPPPPTTTAAPLAQEQGCDPNYDPCVPIDSDVDCAGGAGNGPSYVRGPVRVIGRDVYGLDGNDDDGWGCE